MRRRLRTYESNRLKQPQSIDFLQISKVKESRSTLKLTKKIRGYGVQSPRTRVYVNHLTDNLDMLSTEKFHISHFAVPMHVSN